MTLALRPDIAAAMRRMSVTLGTRSAIRHLSNHLQPAENVREMTACFFAGGDGLLVLTDQRLLAVRDDFSRHKVNSVPLPAVTHLDYGPHVHDGFCAYWGTGKLAVRRMPPADIARLVDALLTMAPQIRVFVSAPGVRPPTVASLPPANPVQPHLAEVAAGSVSTTALVSDPSAAQAHQAPASSAPGAPSGATSAFSSVATDQPSAGVSAGAPDPLVESVTTQQDVLYGVLADLHAKGILSNDELAEKIALVAAMN